MCSNLQERVVQLSLVALVSLTLASVNSANAATASLDDLLTGGILDLGSVTITDFTEINSSNTGFSTSIETSEVVVDATLMDNVVELQFLSFVAGASAGGTVDYDFSFVVNANAGISEVQLVQLAGGPGPDANTTVDENITFAGGMADLATSDDMIFATTTLPNPTSITVQKNVAVRSSDVSTAQISRITQTYLLVPEMDAMGLAMFVFIGGIGMTRKKRRHQS